MYVILDEECEFLAHYPEAEKPSYETCAEYLATLWGIESGDRLMELNPDLVLRVTYLH